MPEIHNIFTILGLRFDHQSGLDDSSGRNWTSFPYGIQFRVYLMFHKQVTAQKDTDNYRLTNDSNIIGVVCQKTKKHLRQACSVVNNAWGYQYMQKCNQLNIAAQNNIPYWYYIGCYISLMLPLLLIPSWGIRLICNTVDI